MKPPSAFLMVLAGLLIAFTARAYGYTAQDFGTSLEAMYREYAAQPPVKNRMFVCVNDCMDDPRYFKYSKERLRVLKSMLASGSPAEERKAIARSVKWMENRIGHTGNSCTGKALNVTSHIIILHDNNLLRFHRPHKPMGKLCLPKWPHWAGMIRDVQTTDVWAVDSYLDRKHDRVLVQPFDTWYCK